MRRDFDAANAARRKVLIIPLCTLLRPGIRIQSSAPAPSGSAQHGFSPASLATMSSDGPSFALMIWPECCWVSQVRAVGAPFSAALVSLSGADRLV